MIEVTGPFITACTLLAGALAPPALLTTDCGDKKVRLAPRLTSVIVTGTFTPAFKAEKSALSVLSSPPNLNCKLYTGCEKVHVYSAISPLGKSVFCD